MKRKILFKMTGSIACYKACNLISKLVQNNFEVQVVASPSALQFVGAATLEGLSGRPVVSDIFESGRIMDHIHLIRWADLVIVSPATANYINKIAQGVGDDLLTTLFLAHDFKKPYLIAPAMNTMMYMHPLTQGSLQKLKGLGIQVLETASGVLACGEMGWGKLLDPELMYQEIQNALNEAPTSSTKLSTANAGQKMPKVLITFGGTQENIDGVRMLGNFSSGRTGARITETLVSLGFDVTALHATNSVRPETKCEQLSFTDFHSLESQLKACLQKNDYSAVIHLAAVSDYSLAKIRIGNKELTGASHEKLPSDENLTLEFKTNPKLIDQIRSFSRNKDLLLVGFKLTNTESETTRKDAALSLLKRSQCDIVVHNDLHSIQAGQHFFTVFANDDASFCPDVQQLSSYLAQIVFEKSTAPAPKLEVNL